MGVAVSGMHYTGMSAVSIHVHGTANGSWAGDSPMSLLLPMLLGPVVFLLLAGVVVMFDPLLVLGEGDGAGPASRPGAAAIGSAANSMPFAAQSTPHDTGRRPPASREREPRCGRLPSRRSIVTVHRCLTPHAIPPKAPAGAAPNAARTSS